MRSVRQKDQNHRGGTRHEGGRENGGMPLEIAHRPHLSFLPSLLELARIPVALPLE